MKITHVKFYLAAILAAVTAFAASAQKLPSEQKESVYAPTGLKIDGKTTEWDNKFQAHNNATMLYYTLANDVDNLYLVMQTDQQSATAKIFYGGISLEIRSRDKNKMTSHAKVTFPLVSLTQRSEIVMPLRDKNNNVDSAVTAANAALQNYAKQIDIEGLDGLTEPDVSVYNELGLKAAVRADISRNVSFEIQIPLKYIKQLIDENGTFDYSIIVNGATIKPGTIVVSGVKLGGGGAVNVSSPDTNPIFTPTYLKGSYTLAKK